MGCPWLSRQYIYLQRIQPTTGIARDIFHVQTPFKSAFRNIYSPIHNWSNFLNQLSIHQPTDYSTLKSSHLSIYPRIKSVHAPIHLSQDPSSTHPSIHASTEEQHSSCYDIRILVAICLFEDVALLFYFIVSTDPSNYLLWCLWWSQKSNHLSLPPTANYPFINEQLSDRLSPSRILLLFEHFRQL